MTGVLVDITALTRHFGAAPALQGVDLQIHRGSFHGLLGPNGAGKTTLIAILCGLLQPDSGSVWVNAADGVRLSPPDARHLIGLVPQDLAFYPTLTVNENLGFFAAMHDLHGASLREGIHRALRLGQLESYRHRRADTLSGGLKRRLNLAIGVVHSPALLILDEPTVGVDAQSRQFLHEVLRELHRAGTTVIYTSHYLEEVQELCDPITVVDQGRIVANGSTRALLGHDNVNLRLAHPPPAAFLTALRAIIGVHEMRQTADRIMLVTESAQAVLHQALAIADDLGIGIDEATMGQRDLNALFFRLTGRDMPTPSDEIGLADTPRQ